MGREGCAASCVATTSLSGVCACADAMAIAVSFAEMWMKSSYIFANPPWMKDDEEWEELLTIRPSAPPSLPELLVGTPPPVSGPDDHEQPRMAAMSSFGCG